MRISRSGMKGARNKRQRKTAAANEQQKLGEKTLKHQAEVETENHVEEEEDAEFKNQVRTVKKSHEVRNRSHSNRHRVEGRDGDAAEVQQTVRQSQAAEEPERTRTVRERRRQVGLMD